MLRVRKNDQILVGCKLSGVALIVAQLIACGPSVSSGGGPIEDGAAGAGASGNPPTSSCECLASYGGTSLGESELVRLRDEGLTKCFHQNDPAALDGERACLPSIVGQYASNGHDIEVYYFCSDVCPEYGRVGIRFAGVKDNASCCAMGGAPLHDPAWGGFEACVPSEISPNVPWVDKCP